MGYSVIKNIDNREHVLFSNKTEIDALKIMNHLIEEYAEELINMYPDINAISAITIAEERFILRAENKK